MPLHFLQQVWIRIFYDVSHQKVFVSEITEYLFMKQEAFIEQKRDKSSHYGLVRQAQK